MMAISEKTENVVEPLCKNCKYICVVTATSMHNCCFMLLCVCVCVRVCMCLRSFVLNNKFFTASQPIG